MYIQIIFLGFIGSAYSLRIANFIIGPIPLFPKLITFKFLSFFSIWFAILNFEKTHSP